MDISLSEDVLDKEVTVVNDEADQRIGAEARLRRLSAMCARRLPRNAPQESATRRQKLYPGG
jgi:hypothetical protein